jgi:hypothetical protein
MRLCEIDVIQNQCVLHHYRMLMYHFCDVNGDVEVMVVMNYGLFKTWGKVGKDHFWMSLPVVVVIV